uniref:DUF4221 family protein n=1 Tax=Roseivirga sp. TaxID=1964215 RepID=UPI004047FB5E
MRYFFILFLLICLVGVSCSSSSSNNKFDSIYSFQKVDSLTIDLDEKTSFEFRNIHYFQNDSLEWLVTLNENINGLNIYDLNSSRLVSQFSVPRSGPHSVPSLNGFTIISPDSIFLYTKISIRNIEVVNYLGDTVGNIRVSNPLDVAEHGQPILNHVSNNPGPTIFRDNKLYFSKWPVFDFSMAQNITKEYSLEAVVDLKSLKISEMNVNYPEWVQYKGWHISYLLNGKTMNSRGDFIYTLQGDDSISVHFNNGEKKRFYAGLSKTGSEKTPITKRTQKNREVEDVMSTTIYWGMLYDKYRDLYYRIADNAIPFTSEHRSIMSVLEKPLSIIVLNNEFRKVGEYDLPKNIYYFYGIFIGENGLYIPRLNSKYAGFSEDLVTFSIYKPYKNDN